MANIKLLESMEAVDWVDWLHFAVGVGCIVWLVVDAVSRLVGHPLLVTDSLLFAAVPTAVMTAYLTWPESEKKIGRKHRRHSNDSAGADDCARPSDLEKGG